MELKLAGKTAMVTGGGAGIGREICIRLAELGANVMVTDIDTENAAKTAGLLDVSIGQRHASIFLDVAKKSSALEAVIRTADLLGGIDILVNNAGVSTMNRVEDLSEEEWDFNFNVNIKGVFFVTQAALALLKKSRGKIVNTASMASVKAAPLLSHYSATKFAVLGFTKACALEFAEYGITVNCVCPGYVQTSMQQREVQWEAALRGMAPEQVINEYIGLTPLGRLCTPRDVAKVVGFLASEDADYLTGEAIAVSGGAMCK